MNAWQNLLANSVLVAGSAWELLTNPKPSSTGLIVNDGVYAEVQDMQIEVVLEDTGASVEVEDQQITAELDTAAIEVEVNE